MILELVKRDPALRVGLIVGAVAPLLAAAALSSPGMMGGILGGMLFPAALTVQPNMRATLFLSGLPVSGRQLFLSRLLAAGSLAWLPLLTGGLTLLALGHSELLVRVVEVAALLSLMLLTPMAIRVRQRSSPLWLAGIIWLVLMAAGVSAIVHLHRLLFLALAGASWGAMFFKAWAEVPPSFQTAPLEAASWRANTRLPQWTQTRRAPAWWLMVRHSLPWWVMAYPIFVGLQAATGNWVYGCCFALIILGQSRAGSRWLCSTPISPTALFLLGSLPAILPLMVGSMIHVRTWPIPASRQALVREGEIDFLKTSGRHSGAGPRVQVPLEFWRRALGGVAPALQSPWGETYQPEAHSFYVVSLYNPYGSSAESSDQFRDWQFRRATVAVYGQALNQKQLPLALAAGLRPVTESPLMQFLYVASSLVLCLAMIWLLDFQAWHWFSRFSMKIRTTVFGGAVLVALLAMMALDLPNKGNGDIPVTTAVVKAVLVWVAARAPSVAVLAAAALVVGASAWLARKQFAVSEWPVTQQNCWRTMWSTKE